MLQYAMRRLDKTMGLFKDTSKTGFNSYEGFVRDIANNLTDEPLVYSNNFPQLYQRRLGKAAGLLIGFAQGKFKLARSASDMGSDSCYNYVGGKFIESVGRDNQRWPLFGCAKVGEGERVEDDLSFFIMCHKQSPRGCSRNQMTSRMLLIERNQQDEVLEGEGVPVRVSVGLSRVADGLQILIASMSSVVTSLIKFPPSNRGDVWFCLTVVRQC